MNTLFLYDNLFFNKFINLLPSIKFDSKKRCYIENTYIYN